MAFALQPLSRAWNRHLICKLHLPVSSCCFITSSSVFNRREGKFSPTATQRVKQRIRDAQRVRQRLRNAISKENIATVPNLLCVGRIVCAPVLSYLVISENFPYACGLFVFAGFTDLLDGYIARTFPSQQSMLGSFLDPMADKLLISCLFVSLTFVKLIPVPLTVLVIMRDVLLMVAAASVRFSSLPPPRTMIQFLDPTLATAKLSPTFISKCNTAIQLGLVGVTLAAPVFNYVDHPYLHTLWYVTAATTVGSALSYLIARNTYKVVFKSKSKS